MIADLCAFIRVLRCCLRASVRSALVLLAVASLTVQPVSAQEASSEVTDAEIAGYKVTVKKACMDPGLARGDPPERVEAFCSCVVEVLEKSMTRSEWQQAYFYSRREDAAEEKRIVGPHFSKLQVCRPK